jgi:hypothetical protein
MTAPRITLPFAALLSALCAGCDNPEPFEPVPPAEFEAAAGVKVNAPSNSKAVAVSHSQIAVSWHDNSSNETGFEVHRSTTGENGSFAELTIVGPNIVSYSDGGLVPSTAYCYKLRAFRTTGNRRNYSAFTSATCATTQVPPLPAAPSGVNATPVSGYKISITWTDNSTDETSFRVERSAADAGPWTASGKTGPGATSLDDYQVPAGDQPACYRVFALNSFGDSKPSNVDCTTVPAAPTDLAATVLADGTVDLTWTDRSTIEEGYELLRGDGGGAGLSVVKTLPANTTGYRDAGLADNSYGYVVRATKDGGSSSNSNFVQVVVATKPPIAPTNVDAMPGSSSSVSVSWVDLATNEEGFRIERSTDGGASWVAATGYQQGTWFWEEGLSSEQKVCYRVIAFNRVGDSPPSNTDCTTPPAAPTDFTATDAGSDVIDFAWSDNSAVEDGYYIFIDYGFGYWEAVAFVDPNTTTFRFEGYPGAAFQTYFMAAYKDGGYSDWSNFASPTSGALSSSVRSSPSSRGPPHGSKLDRPADRR